MSWFSKKSVTAAKRIAISPPEPEPGRHGVAIAACVLNRMLELGRDGRSISASHDPERG